MCYIHSDRCAFGDASRGLGRQAARGGAYCSVFRLCAAMLMAAALAACSQTTSRERVASRTHDREAWTEQKRTASTEPKRKAWTKHRPLATVAKRHAPLPDKKDAAAHATVGIASFYGHGEKTANGEKFDPRELTAAHRTLPFGTRLRVTNMSTGQSVTVRVNDRGPFIPGRVVDVSVSAAETLGITERGVAKVKLDVVD